MRTHLAYRLVQVLGLLLTPVLAFWLIAGATTLDGDFLSSVFVVVIPLGLYGVGLFLALKKLSQRESDRQPGAV